MTSTQWALGLLFFFVIFAGLGLHYLWQAAEAANVTDWGGKWRNRIDGLSRLMLRHYHGFDPEPIPIPDNGPALLVANHISGLDPMMMIAACHRPVRFIIAIEQYNRFGLKWLFKLGGCIPVDRKTRDDSAFKAALDALHRGEIVGLFPHGRIAVPGEEQHPRIRRGVARLASLSHAPVYPMRISGIRAEGHVVLSVLIRSRGVCVEMFPSLECHLDDEKTCLEKLTKILNKSAT